MIFKHPLALLIFISALIHLGFISTIRLELKTNKEEKVFQVELAPPIIVRSRPETKSVPVAARRKIYKKQSVLEIKKKGTARVSSKPRKKALTPKVKAPGRISTVKPLAKPILGGLSARKLKSGDKSVRFDMNSMGKLPESESISNDVTLPKVRESVTGKPDGNSVEKITSSVIQVDVRPDFIDKSDIKPVVKQRKIRNGQHGDELKTPKNIGAGMIRGEVAYRKVVYRPKAPRLKIEKDVTIILSFTVLPNGSVDQITPYRKADPTLEQTAIRLLREYRFEPLLTGSQVQAGRIHFILRRK